MSEVKRYDPDTDGHYGLISAVMREEPTGDYVKYDDFISVTSPLLEALKDCVNRLVAAFPAAEDYEPVKAARAAIAKAEGRP
jgi:hypothetical protein